jgi:hypothetical protein
MFGQQQLTETTGSSSSSSGASTLGFYCADTLDQEHPFSVPTEVLLSISMVPIIDPTTKAITFSPKEQSGQGFTDMVNAIISQPNIAKLTLLDTSYLQRHRIILRKLAEGKTELEAEEEAEKEAIENSKIWREQHGAQINSLMARFNENFYILDWKAIIDGPQKEDIGKRIAAVNRLYSSHIPLSPDEKGKTISVDSFNKAVKGLISIFSKKISENDPIKLSTSIANSTIKRYLTTIAIEESVVRTFFKYPFEIYRGICNVAASMLYDFFGEKGEMRFVTVGNHVEIAHRKEVDEKNKPQPQRPKSSPPLARLTQHNSKSPPSSPSHGQSPNEHSSPSGGSFSSFFRARTTGLPITHSERAAAHGREPLQHSEEAVEIEIENQTIKTRVRIRCRPESVAKTIDPIMASLASSAQMLMSGQVKALPSPVTSAEPSATAITAPAKTN